MNAIEFVEALRADIAQGLREQILAELEPEITRRLYANIFTLPQAAEYLKISEPMLRGMVARREIPFFRHRKVIFFRQYELDKHIESLMEYPSRPSRERDQEEAI